MVECLVFFYILEVHSLCAIDFFSEQAYIMSRGVKFSAQLMLLEQATRLILEIVAKFTLLVFHKIKLIYLILCLIQYYHESILYLIP